MIDRKYVINYINERFFDSDVSDILIKKLKILDDYNDDVILQTFKKCAGSIDYAFHNKKFINDKNRVSYMMKIVESKIAFIEREICKKKKIAEAKFDITKNEMEDVQATKQRKRDISKFLGDDDF